MGGIKLNDRQWSALLSEYEELCAADRNYIRALAAVFGSLIAIAGAVAVILEKLSDSSPNNFPSWAWAFVPLPALGVTALFVFLQTGAALRSKYLLEVETTLYRGQGIEDESYVFPAYNHLSRQAWEGKRAVALILISLASLLSVILLLNVLALAVTRPLCILVIAASVYGVAWLILGKIFWDNWSGKVWDDAAGRRRRVMATEVGSSSLP